VHYLVVFHRIHSGGEKVPLCNLLVIGFSPIRCNEIVPYKFYLFHFRKNLCGMVSSLH